MAQEAVFQDACFQPLIDHPSDHTIRDSQVKKVWKMGVRNRIEIFYDVDIKHPPQSLTHDGSMQSLQCLMSRERLGLGLRMAVAWLPANQHDGVFSVPRYIARIRAQVFNTCDILPRFSLPSKLENPAVSKLKTQIDAALASKIAEECRSLEEQLGKLSRMTGTGSRASGQRGGPRGKPAPKYGNPANPSETWLDAV